MPSLSWYSNAYGTSSYKRGMCIGFWRDRAAIKLWMDICAAELATWGVGPDVNPNSYTIYSANNLPSCTCTINLDSACNHMDVQVGVYTWCPGHVHGDSLQSQLAISKILCLFVQSKHEVAAF